MASLALPDIKMYYKIILIGMCGIGRRMGQTDMQKKLEGPELELCLEGHLI